MSLHLTDIPNRKPLRLTRFVVNRNGVWFFESPANHATEIKHGFSRYYKISLAFGVTKNNVTDASDTYTKGSPGDYLVLHATGEYTVLPAAEYNVLFSTKI